MQNITIFCKNSIAFYDSTKQNYKKAIKLMSYNDIELTAEGNQLFNYKVIKDGCQVSDKLSLLIN